jgi:hypothetical protein
LASDEAKQMSELLEEGLAAMEKYRAQTDKDKLEIEGGGPF